MSDWLNDKTMRKARTDYPCVWCGDPIAAGSVYAAQSGCFDGCLQVLRWHCECWRDGAEENDKRPSHPPERPSPP